MKNENIKDIIAENRRRTARLADNYDPISGQGCLGERITVKRRGGKDVLVPATMTADPSYRKQMSAHDFNHPLAGCNLRFDGTVVTVRDATEAELHPQCGGCSGDCGEGGCSGCSGGCH